MYQSNILLQRITYLYQRIDGVLSACEDMYYIEQKENRFKHENSQKPSLEMSKIQIQFNIRTKF